MNNKYSNFNNDQLVKAYEYKSKILTNQKNKLINEYTYILKSYKDIWMETNVLSQKINSLKNVYEQEIQIKYLYQNFPKVSEDVDSYEVLNNEFDILEKNMNDLTEGQRLKIKTNRNAALILRMEKQLNVVNSKLDERKSHFVNAYKNYLHSQY
uniref:Uncharacterized protein n=1 Tax=Sipha flava TaxID=143950 RepID=A0A2S2QDP7_9HEMI